MGRLSTRPLHTSLLLAMSASKEDGINDDDDEDVGNDDITIFTVSAIEVHIHIQVRLHDHRRGYKDMWGG